MYLYYFVIFASTAILLRLGCSLLHNRKCGTGIVSNMLQQPFWNELKVKQKMKNSRSVCKALPFTPSLCLNKGQSEHMAPHQCWWTSAAALSPEWVCARVWEREGERGCAFFTFPKWHVHHSKATCGLSQQQQQQQNVTRTKTKLRHHHQREQSQSASLSPHKDPMRRQKEWKCMLWIRSAYRQSLPRKILNTEISQIFTSHPSKYSRAT